MTTNTIDMGMVRRGAEALREIPHPDTWTSGQRNIARESAGIIDTLADALDAARQTIGVMRAGMEGAATTVGRYEARALTAEAEVARLRAALPEAVARLERAARMLEDDWPGVAIGLRLSASDLRALAAGAETTTGTDDV